MIWKGEMVWNSGWMIKVMWISGFFYGAPVLCKSVTELAEPMYCTLHLLHWINPIGAIGFIVVSFLNFWYREVKHHVYVKRQKRICTTWPIFPFTCRLLFIISTHKYVVSRNFLSIKNFWAVFICSFSTWIWCLPFAVYVKLKLSNIIVILVKYSREKKRAYLCSYIYLLTYVIIILMEPKPKEFSYLAENSHKWNLFFRSVKMT